MESMKAIFWIGFGFAASLTLGLAAWGESSEPPAAYPQGYRQWTHLHSTVVGPKHSAFAKRPCESPCSGGIFHFYANSKAMEGFRNGGKFADGSILADEVLETRQTPGGASIEGPRRGVGVMVKDSRLYASTGGWGFGAFDSGSQTQILTSQEQHDCYQCHVRRQDHDYVFTVYEDR